MAIDITQAYTYGVDDETAREFIEFRKLIKKPLTQRAFDRAMIQACRCAGELEIGANEAVELSIDKGWQAPTFEYIKAELERRNEAANRKQIVVAGTRQDFINKITDRSWSH